MAPSHRQPSVTIRNAIFIMDDSQLPNELVEMVHASCALLASALTRGTARQEHAQPRRGSCIHFSRAAPGTTSPPRCVQLEAIARYRSDGRDPNILAQIEQFFLDFTDIPNVKTR